MRNLNLLLLLGCLSLLPVSGRTQDEFNITPFSANYVSSAMLDSITSTTLRAAAEKKSVGPALFNDRYNAYRSRIAELVKSFVLFSFRELDMKYRPTLPDPGSPAFRLRQEAYLSKVREALDRMIETPASVHPLLEADESDRVLFFDAGLKVQASGKIEVKEIIRIYNGDGGMLSENDDIKRGILRDFPTKYLHADGYWVHTGFQLKSVRLDGEETAYSSQSLDNGTRIQIGNADYVLPKGIYTYELIYETNRQLIFHTDRDELYWNVNGNGWVFRFDTVSATIEFPDQAEILAWQCYTGVMGSTEQNCSASKIAGNKIAFQTTTGLQSYEGLTIAADIGKGILLPPTKASNALNFLRANWLIPLLLTILLLVPAFYWIIWRKKGKDPEKGTIYPQFEPPPGLRPADVGFIHQQQYGSHLFVASLVDAAVQKQLEIEVNKGGSWFAGTEYQFNKINHVASPSASILMQRFGLDISALYGMQIKSGTYNSTLKALYTSLETQLKNKFQLEKGHNKKEGYFSLNRGVIFWGAFLLFISFGASIVFLIQHFTVPLGIFAVTCLVLLLVILIFFYRILPAYTKEGRKIADHIEGFKMYLDHTEQQVFNTLAPPEKTLDLFERFLPYAIALKVENAWAEQFDSLLQRALEQGYQPTYFHAGRGFSQNLQFADLTKGVSSGLSSTISSSSTPPSSSSGGSRGGGSSGGGGGGGGGGGW